MTTEVDDYLAAVPDTSRSALEDLRRTIMEVVPDATETISYKVPTFKYQGRPLVAYGATETGCTFYLMSTDVFNAFKTQLKDYKTGKGSVRFEPGNPPPAGPRPEDRQSPNLRELREIPLDIALRRATTPGDRQHCVWSLRPIARQRIGDSFLATPALGTWARAVG